MDVRPFNASLNFALSVLHLCRIVTKVIVPLKIGRLQEKKTFLSIWIADISSLKGVDHPKLYIYILYILTRSRWRPKPEPVGSWFSWFIDGKKKNHKGIS